MKLQTEAPFPKIFLLRQRREKKVGNQILEMLEKQDDERWNMMSAYTLYDYYYNIPV